MLLQSQWMTHWNTDTLKLSPWLIWPHTASVSECTVPLQSTRIFLSFWQAFRKGSERQYIYKLMGFLISSLVKNDSKSEAKGCLSTRHPFGLESQATVIELPSCCCMVTNARWRRALERSCAHLSTFQVDAPSGIGDGLLKCVGSQFTD